MNRRGFLCLGFAPFIKLSARPQTYDIPIGYCLPFKEHPGAKYLPCDGRMIDPREYPELHTLLRDAYGPNRIPDFRRYNRIRFIGQSEVYQATFTDIVYIRAK